MFYLFYESSKNLQITAPRARPLKKPTPNNICPREKTKGRTLSPFRDYLLPIVKGKEIKKVEFGFKINKLQIDRINFIVHINFDAFFNEEAHFKGAIYKAQRLTGIKTKVAGADVIYTTNNNRVFATFNKIKTDFRPKGKPTKHRKKQNQLRSLITKLTQIRN